MANILYFSLISFFIFNFSHARLTTEDSQKKTTQSGILVHIKNKQMVCAYSASNDINNDIEQNIELTLCDKEIGLKMIASADSAREQLMAAGIPGNFPVHNLVGPYSLSTKLIFGGILAIPCLASAAVKEYVDEYLQQLYSYAAGFGTGGLIFGGFTLASGGGPYSLILFGFGATIGLACSGAADGIEYILEDLFETNDIY